MRDESFDDTPSTPVRAPLHLEDEDDLTTPTKLSPSATRLNAPRDSLTRAAGTKAEVAAQKEGNAVRLSYDNDLGSVPIILDTRPELKEGKGEDGGNPIDTTIQQELDIQTEVDLEVEAGIEGNGQVVKDDEEKVAVAFADSEAEEVKEEVGGFGDDLGQPGVAKDNDDVFAGSFDDDFDEFGETVEGDDDFDDFEGFEEGCTPRFSEPPPPAPPPPPAVLALPVPVIDFDSFDSSEDAQSAICDMVSKLYSTDEADPPKKPLQRTRTGMFLTERSESLWNQLAAPPPLQPPDWKRSRIRRLFLVSLGVPVDLDEILPASKQKKLVLPSTKALPAHLTTSSAPSSSAPPSRRSSMDSVSGVSRHNRSKSRNRAATGSRAPSSHRTSRADKNPPMPEFDEPAARILCTTSDLVLEGMTEKDLRKHIKTLQELTSIASELLTWWLKKRDGAMGDKETFETVIESLVGYARKTRTGAR
ncbi:hypothetical protein EV426DRAFT_114396 [Tirmania nivea]|nr:hypothetical protein EV426DRAFT_114396 [Tirmania nivea]